MGEGGGGGRGACGLRAKSHGGSELGRLNLAAARGCAAGKDQTLCARDVGKALRIHDTLPSSGRLLWCDHFQRVRLPVG